MVAQLLEGIFEMNFLAVQKDEYLIAALWCALPPSPSSTPFVPPTAADAVCEILVDLTVVLCSVQEVANASLKYTD